MAALELARRGEVTPGPAEPFGDIAIRGVAPGDRARPPGRGPALPVSPTRCRWSRCAR